MRGNAGKLGKLNNLIRKLGGNLRNRMDQMKYRILGLEDKLEELDHTSK